MRKNTRHVLLPLLAVVFLGIIAFPGRTFPVHLDEQQPYKLINRQVDLTNGFYQGNFTYSYPFDLPGGLGGLTPFLALCYNSELTEERFVAVGWELIGFAGISRETSAATPTYDDRRDTFLLNLDGRNYRIRNEEGQPYFENSAMNLSFDGEKWQVTQTDGVVYVFVPGARFAAGIFDWVAESIADSNGNKIEFTYDSSLLQAEGIVYPQKIVYLGEHEAPVIVDLAWEDAGDRRFESYWTTYRQVYTRRLQRVSVNVANPEGQPVTVETYELGYHRSAASANNLLDRIMDRNNHAVSFTYESDATTEETPRWQSGGEWAFPGEFAQNETAASKRIDYDFLFRDLNQDGYPDLILQERLTDLSFSLGFKFYGERLPRIYINDKEGGWLRSEDFLQAAGVHMTEDYNNPHPPQNLGDNGEVEFRQEIRPIFTDLDGDGYLDLTFHAIYDCYWTYYQSAQPGPGPFINPPVKYEGFYYNQELVSFRNDGQGRFTFLRKTRARRTTSLDEKLPPVPQVDMNGDGQADPPPVIDDGVAIMLDANADDRTDFFAGHQVLFNNGDGATTAGTGRHLTTANFFHRLFRGDDLDNDGRLDEWTVERLGEGRYKLHFPNSPDRDLELNDARLLYCRPYFLPRGSYNYWNGNVFTDLNNDGRLDLFTPAGAYINQTKPDFLCAITDEEERETTEIAYEQQTVTAQPGDPGLHLPQARRWAVKSVTADERTTTFTYHDGLLDVPARCFRGYGRIEVSDGAETTAYTYETADPRLIGMCLKVEGPEETVTNEYTVEGTEKQWRVSAVKTVITTPRDGTSCIEKTYNEHDSLSRQEQVVTTPEGHVHTSAMEYEYPSEGTIKVLPSRIRVRDAAGHLTQDTVYEYDGQPSGVVKGNLTGITTKVLPAGSDSEDLVTYFIYDEHGRMEASLDVFGNRTTTAERLTAEGRERTTTNALGHTTRELYDPVTGLLKWSEDVNGGRMTYDYYADSRLKKVSPPGGGWTEYLYDKKPDGTRLDVTLTRIAAGSDRLRWSESQTGRRWSKTIAKEVVETETGFGRAEGWYRINEAGQKRLRTFTTVNRVVVSEQYTNADGQTTSASLPYLAGETPRYIVYTYEPAGKKRPIKTENPDGTYAAYTYDDAAHRVTITDQAGRTTTTQESYAYAFIEETGEVLCRIVNLTAPDGTITRSYYSMEGDLLQVTDDNGKNRITKYDNLHRVICTKDPFKGRNTFTYDATGQPKKTVDNKGTVIELNYDALGRMTAKRFPSGREIKYIYDLSTADDPIHTNCIGRLAAHEDPSGTTRFGYDTASRLIAAKRNGFNAVRYEYDYVGLVTSLTYPNGYAVNYQYELSGLTKVTDANKTLAAYSDFAAHGLHRKAVYGNGTVTNYGFDPRSGRLMAIRVNQGQLLDLVYTYDPAGNISSIADLANASPQHPRNVTETYTYDLNNRLISAAGPYGTKTYSYDAVGNFLSKEGVYYSYTDPTRPYAVTEGSDGFRAQYDNNGNMVAQTDPLEDEFVYSYDEENQLIKAVKNGTQVDDFVYDANGMRVRKSANGAVTDYFYDGVNLLYEVTGGIGKNHIWANGTLLCTVEGSDYTYYHTDHLGTSKLQTDDQGKVLSIDITKPYGPVAREGVMSDTFSDLSKIDPDKSRFQYDAATGTILPPARGRGLPKQITDNHEVTVEKTAYERVKNIRLIQTASDQTNTELKIEFDFVGKARLTVKNKAGDIVFQDEYSGTDLKSKTIRVEVGYTLNQAYTVVLELAARNSSTPSRNTIFSVSWGEAEADYGFIRSLPVTFATDVYAVKLNLVGTGVTFYLNTGGKLWQRIEPGQETILDQPDRTLTIRAYLTLDEGTNLQSYGLEINPYHDMSFTGKFLEPEIGLAYFGARWYEPGTGRWVTVDPAGSGLGWYGYCGGNPISYLDNDGQVLILALLLNLSICAAMTPPDTPADEFFLMMGAYALGTMTGYLMPGPGIIKGIASSFVQSATSQYIENGKIAWGLVAFDTAVGGAIGYGSDKFAQFTNRLGPRPLGGNASEQYLASKLGNNFKPQVTCQNGNVLDVNYIVKNSTRPDFLGKNSWGIQQSLEVKNCLVSTAKGAKTFVQRIAQQAIDRAFHLPNGTKQILYVDIRGQNIAFNDLYGLISKVKEASHGLISRVIFIRYPGQFNIPFSSRRSK